MTAPVVVAPAVAAPVAAAPATSPWAAVPGDFVGRHTTTGQVTKIDNSKGTFSLKTAEAGTLDLHAPPSALAGVKSGDTLVIEIAVKPTQSPRPARDALSRCGSPKASRAVAASLAACAGNPSDSST